MPKPTVPVFPAVVLAGTLAPLVMYRDHDPHTHPDPVRNPPMRANMPTADVTTPAMTSSAVTFGLPDWWKPV